MRALRWVFVAQTAPRPPEPFVDLLHTLPGVRAKRTPDGQGIHVTASFDSGALVGGFLRGQGFAVNVVSQPAPLPELPVEDLVAVGLRSEMVGRVTEPQRRGLSFFQQRGGGLAKWPCGSGKTFLAILFLLACRAKTQQAGAARPPRTVVVTRGSTTFQWVGQIRKFTTIDTDKEVSVLDSFTRYDARPSPEVPTVKRVYRVGDLGPEQIQAAGIKRTQAMLDAVTWLLEHDGAEWSTVPTPRRPQVLRLIEVGLAEARLEQDGAMLQAWQPWCVYDKTHDRVHSYIETDTQPIMLGESETRQWLNAAQNPNNSAAVIRHAYTLYRRSMHVPVDVIAQELAVASVCWPEGDDPATRPERALADVRSVLGHYLGDLKVGALHASLQVPDSVWLVIVGWPVVSTWVDALKSWKPEVVIEDESHNAKNPKHWDPVPQPDGTTRFTRKDTQAAAMADLMAVRSVRHTLLTTATPADNAVKDWWAQVHHLDPFCFNKYHPWSVRYCNGHQGPYAWVDDDASNEEELKGRLGSFVHEVTAEEALGALPPLLLTVTHLPAEKQDRASYDLSEAKAVARQGASALLQWELDQAAFRTTTHALTSVKEALREGEKVVLLTGRTAHALALHKAVLGMVSEDRVFLGTGADDPSERAGLIEGLLACQGGAVLVGTLLAWKEGIDGLQHVNRALILTLPWTLAIEQVLGRFRRLGGTHSVSVEIVVPEDTIAERVLARLEGKIAKIASVEPNQGTQHLATTLYEGRTADDEARLARLAEKLLSGSGGDEDGWLDGGED